MRRKLLALLCLVAVVFVLYSHQDISNQHGYPMYNHYVTMSHLETGAVNIVAAIYLFYRYYDTLFEAMMLLVSIIAVIFLSVHEGGDQYE